MVTNKHGAAKRSDGKKGVAQQLTALGSLDADDDEEEGVVDVDDDDDDDLDDEDGDEDDEEGDDDEEDGEVGLEYLQKSNIEVSCNPNYISFFSVLFDIGRMSRTLVSVEQSL